MERLQLIDNAEYYPENDKQTTRRESEDLILMSMPRKRGMDISMKRRYLSGQSIAEIAAYYHLSEKAIRARLFYLGLSSESPD